MKSEPETAAPGPALAPEERRRRRREALLIVLLGSGFLLLALSQVRLSALRAGSPSGGSVLFFLLINLNVILLVLLVFLVTRNVVKLVFERRRRILGSGIRTKLVLAFVSLSLVPTLLLFFVALGFLGAAMNTWFSSQVQRSLEGSLQVAEAYYQERGDRNLGYARRLAERIARGDMLAAASPDPLDRYLERMRSELGVDTIEVLVGRDVMARAAAPEAGRNLPPLEAEDLRAVLLHGRPFARTQRHGAGEIVRAGAPIRSPEGEVRGAVVVGSLVPRAIAKAARQTVLPYERFRELEVLKQPVKNGYTISFVLITLAVLFSATWFGFYLAREMTVPIERLAQGMRAVAQGNWSHRVDPEGDVEIASLAESFNQMAADLEVSHRALQERHHYIESILTNIAAGVLSVDPSGVVATINPAAGMMLGLRPEDTLGRRWEEVFSGPLAPIGELVGDVLAGKEKAEREVRAGGATLWATATSLRGPADAHTGGAMVFLEDVTYLHRVERMEAWREVARRIAHEIKNPLTPIQLSAQRLRRRCGDSLDPERAAVLDECTRTIVSQVEQLKRMVNEFSAFARLPAVHPEPGDLNALVTETVQLFQEGHPALAFSVETDASVPRLEIDREAIRRALLNLLDNAVAACAGAGGSRIEVRTVYDAELGRVRLEVADDGPGMSPEVKARVFEPYFSTKSDGTGLGLAIVSSIAADHRAYVRVQDNQPRGTRLILELPVPRPVTFRPSDHAVGEMT